MAVLESLYFFDQPQGQSKKRQRKPVDQLPFSLPFTGVSGTLKVEAYLKQQLKLSQQQVNNNNNNKEKVIKEDVSNYEQEANEDKKQQSITKVLLEQAETGKRTRNKENKNVTINTETRVEEEEEEEDTQRFLFEENKFAAPNLLARLTRILDYLDEKQYGCDDSDNTCADGGQKWTSMALSNQMTSIIDSAGDVRALNISLPFHLQEKLKWGFEQLISNTVYCKREWQTTSYKQQAETLAAQKTCEQTPINTPPDLCNNRKHSKAEEMTGRRSSKIEETNTRKSSKTEEGSVRKMSKHQLMSDGNIATALKIEFQSPVDSEQSIVGESVLEGYPNVMSVPRESRGNAWYNNLPRTRLEKYRILPDKFVPGSSLERRRRTGLQVKPEEQETQQESDVSMVQLPVSSIAFSLMSKHCEDQGWVTHNDRDLERITLIEWAVNKLKEARTSSAHSGMAVIKKYYGLSSASKKQEDSIVFKQYGEVTSNNKTKKAGKAKIRRTQSGTAKLELFVASLPDGTMTIYYPSGKIALCMANNLVGDGKYTFVYDNTNSTSFMAYLTPTNLCCWDKEKKHVLCDPNGGVIYSADGEILRKWVWTGSKLLPSIFLQLNEYISLKIISHSMMSLEFNCQHESYKLSLSISRDRKCVQHNAMGEIKTIAFQESEISQQAPVPKPKFKSRREERRAAKRRACNTEVEESVQESRKQELNQIFPERINLALDLPEDVDLYKLKRRIRNIAHEWMERYRVMLGITSPIKVMRKHTRRKQTSSAKSLPSTLPSAQSSFRKLEEAVQSFETRVPSAPPVPRGDTRFDFGKVTPLGKLTSLVENLKEHGAQKMNKENKTVSPIYLTEVEKNKTTSGPTSPKPPFRCGLANHEPRCTSPKEGCPIALRSELLGEKYVYCRCKKREIPVVSDLEYDTFIRNHAAQSQLVVVSIVSSRFPDETPGIAMLERFYYEKNRNRTFPCAQGGHDPFRIVLYDIHSSTENDEPLLVKRHNVVPGMFLMYIGGKLLFADHIFNGYGNEKNDFLKQITKSRKDFLHGLFLPQNFRLSPTPCRSGMRSAWGGEIGGISRMAVRNETTLSSTFSCAATRLPSAVTSLSSDSFDYRATGAKSAASFVKLGLSIDSPFGKRVKSNHVTIPSVQKRTKN